MAKHEGGPGGQSEAGASSASAELTEPRRALALLPAFVPLVAPLTLLMTGMLYLAGWIFQRTLIGHFGLSSSMFEFTLQDTLALGYVPVVLGTVVIALLFIAVWILFSIRPSRNPPDDKSRRQLRAPDRFSRAYGMLVVVLVLLAYGFVVGERLANSTAIKIAQDVETGCRLECFGYVVDKTTISGRLIAQDKTRAAVYTRSGVITFKNDMLTRVIPHGTLSQKKYPPIRGIEYQPKPASRR